MAILGLPDDASWNDPRVLSFMTKMSPEGIGLLRPKLGWAMTRCKRSRYSRKIVLIPSNKPDLPRPNAGFCGL